MKNRKPLVTIGIPTYNRPSELKKAINSVIHQNYKNLEIIISDNCSSNKEVEKLCLEYSKKDKRIKYFRQKENIGMARNGEFLLNNARGEYYLWCMDDDWISANFINVAIDFLIKNKDYSIVFGNMNVYNKDYILIKKCIQFSFDEVNYEERLLKYTQTAIISSLSFGLLKTELMKNAYTSKMRLPEDWIFMMKTLSDGKGKYIPNISYNALNNGSSQNIESLKIAFNLPNLTQDNFWNIMSENIVESIIFDDFYQDKLSKEERISLALSINNSLMKNNIKTNIFKRVLNKVRRIYEGL